jgi:hypothetical protein
MREHQEEAPCHVCQHSTRFNCGLYERLLSDVNKDDPDDRILFVVEPTDQREENDKNR